MDENKSSLTSSSQALSFAQMNALCGELNQRLDGFEVTRCLAIGKYKLILEWHNQYTIERLLLNFEEPFLRFHLISQIPKNTSFHSLNSYLAGATFVKAEVLNQDRILRLTFQKHGHSLFWIGEFFPRRGNYFLTDAAGTILYVLHSSSSTAHPQDVYQLPPSPVKQKIEGQRQTFASHRDIEHLYNRLEKEWHFHQERHQLLSQLHREIKRSKNRQLKLEKDLLECSTWEAIQHEAELLKAHFSELKKGLKQIKVWDWLTNEERIILLDVQLTPQQEMAWRFRKGKKLQKGIDHLQKQLDELINKEKMLTNHLIAVEEITQVKDLEAFTKQWGYVPAQTPVSTPSKSKPLSSLPYLEYESVAGIKIWVGKNAKNNEKLTFSLARGSDWWLHVQGWPGSHVVIRTHKGEEPDPETLQDAIQLALYYSQAKKQGEAEVCVTQKKFVSRFGKNATGKVQVSKHKVIWAQLDTQRFARLKKK